jgi:hypothetical protein
MLLIDCHRSPVDGIFHSRPGKGEELPLLLKPSEMHTGGGWMPRDTRAACFGGWLAVSRH